MVPVVLKIRLKQSHRTDFQQSETHSICVFRMDAHWCTTLRVVIDDLMGVFPDIVHNRNDSIVKNEHF